MTKAIRKKRKVATPYELLARSNAQLGLSLIQLRDRVKELDADLRALRYRVERVEQGLKAENIDRRVLDIFRRAVAANEITLWLAGYK